MGYFLLGLLLLSANTLYAAYPTPEGLFRYGPTLDQQGDLILLDLVVHPEKKIEEVEKHPNYIQLLIAPRDQRAELLQLEFARPGFEEKDIIDFQYWPNWGHALGHEATSIRNLFYAIVGMYTLNEGEFMRDLLLRSVPDFKSNRELINFEKRSLMEAKRDYLAQIRNNPDLQESLVSPLRPEDPEERKKVEDIMRMPTYFKADNLFLEREGRNFYWYLRYDNFNAKFSVKNQRIKSLMFRMAEAPIRMRFGEYVVFDGRRELPRYIILETPRGETYRIEVANFRRVVRRGDRVSQLMRELTNRSLDREKQQMIRERRAEFLF